MHFWTFPHTTKDGAVTATTHTKKHLAKMLKEAYGADNIEFYVIVSEQHAQSERAWERTYHWHALLKLTRRIKWKALARQLREKRLFGHLALPRLHADFFRCLRYLVAPTTRKGQDQLDPNPYFSSHFPVDMMEKRMRKYFNISLRPSDMYSIVRQMKFTSYQQLIDWALEQRRRGNGIYEKFLAKQGQKMPGLFASWMQILCEPATAAGLRKQRLELWDRAAQTPCSCVSPNRLQDALDRLLEHHGKCPGRWAFCLTKLLRIGTTAKNSNILLWGESNSGKTALTRPLIHIFENHVFLRPNRGDTFVLQGLEKMLISVFQDWRLSTTPLPYDTLLLLLEGESVSCAVSWLVRPWVVSRSRSNVLLEAAFDSQLCIELSQGQEFRTCASAPSSSIHHNHPDESRAQDSQRRSRRGRAESLSKQIRAALVFQECVIFSPTRSRLEALLLLQRLLCPVDQPVVRAVCGGQPRHRFRSPHGGGNFGETSN